MIWSYTNILRGRPELSSFSRAPTGREGESRATVRFSKMSFVVHCCFEKVSQYQHFQSTLGREGGGHKKEYSVRS